MTIGIIHLSVKAEHWLAVEEAVELWATAVGKRWDGSFSRHFRQRMNGFNYEVGRTDASCLTSFGCDRLIPGQSHCVSPSS